MGEIYTILTSAGFSTRLSAPNIVRVAMLVLPAPVGAQISMLSTPW